MFSEAYTAANRRVKHSIRADKRHYIESLATEAAHRVNPRDLYNTTKKLSRKFASSDMPVKDKQGKDIQSEEGQINRWKEHFEELLNRPAPSSPPDIQPAVSDLDINCEEPTNEETLKAIKQPKSGWTRQYTCRGSEGKSRYHRQNTLPPLP